MVKLASTILAFPNHKLNFNLMSNLNSIEWTAKKLKEKKPHFTKVDTMLSIIDGETTQGLISDDHVQKELANTIQNGIKYNIYKYIYGSPATREFDHYINENETIKIFTDLIYTIDEIIEGDQLQPIQIYIEPLPHHNGWLSSIDKVMKICKQLNHNITLKSEFIDTGIYFVPLIDTGTLLKTGFNFKATEELAFSTDRIHLSQKNNTNEFKDIPTKVLKFVENLCYYNDELTISYEHINTNENSSINDFVKYFQRLLLQNKLKYDVTVIGSGIYGEYIASKLAQKSLKVALIGQEADLHSKDIQIASYVNQARVHNGYHYPRSITTAQASVKHFNQFINQFNDCIIDNFNQIYAIPKYGSQTSAQQFKNFCDNLNVKCEEFISQDLKNNNMQGSFLVDEVAIDTELMMNKMIKSRHKNVSYFDLSINTIHKTNNGWLIYDSDASHIQIESNYIVNATYSNLNEIEKIANQPKTDLKLETCEIALFKSKQKLKNAYTFMDGPFISIMPFSINDQYISMTSVTYTPHKLGKYDLSKLSTNKDLMIQEAKQFLIEDYLNQLEYIESRYVIKAVPLMAEDDDNRLIQINYGDHFVSVLSGKLNAIYECDDMCNKIYKIVHEEKMKGLNF